MKVNFEEIQKHIKTSIKQNRAQQTQNFNKLLEKEIAQESSKVNSHAIIDPNLEISSIETAIKLQNHQPSHIMEKLNLSLDMWEKYSHLLSNNNLKESQETLDGIMNNLSSLKKEDLAQNEEVNNILNEMTIMAMAEKARLLRGDYS